MIAKSICKLAGILVLSLAVAATASAQYGGNPGSGGGGTMPGSGSTTPGTTNTSYGYGSSTGKAVGIGVGVAAAAIVGTMLLVRHHHKAESSAASVVGCTQSVMNGLSLTNENDHQTYTLLSARDLQPGEMVELKGKVTKEGDGSRAFQVREVVTNYGACGATSAANVN